MDVGPCFDIHDYDGTDHDTHEDTDDDTDEETTVAPQEYWPGSPALLPLIKEKITTGPLINVLHETAATHNFCLQDATPAVIFCEFIKLRFKDFGTVLKLVRRSRGSIT